MPRLTVFNCTHYSISTGIVNMPRFIANETYAKGGVKNWIDTTTGEVVSNRFKLNVSAQAQGFKNFAQQTRSSKPVTIEDEKIKRDKSVSKRQKLIQYKYHLGVLDDLEGSMIAIASLYPDTYRLQLLIHYIEEIEDDEEAFSGVKSIASLVVKNNPTNIAHLMEEIKLLFDKYKVRIIVGYTFIVFPIREKRV